MKHPEQPAMPPIRRVVGRIEQALKHVITGGNRFNFPCDSRINLCYYCSLLRIKVRMQDPPFFVIFTKRFVYTFVRKPMKFAIVTRRESFWSLASLGVGDGETYARTT